MFRFFAFIPAAGRGTRMDTAYPKQYLQLAGKPMLCHSVNTLAKIEEIERVFVVLAKDDSRWREMDLDTHAGKVVPLYCGGVERRESVLNGLRLAIGINDEDYILVHDAVRPCVTSAEVRALMREAGHDGALLAIPVADTLKREESGRVAVTVDRQRLWRAQTPQMFRYGTLLRALELAKEATDEAQAVEALGLQPKLVRGDARNLKITLSEDLRMAEMILADRNA